MPILNSTTVLISSELLSLFTLSFSRIVGCSPTQSYLGCEMRARINQHIFYTYKQPNGQKRYILHQLRGEDLQMFRLETPRGAMVPATLRLPYFLRVLSRHLELRTTVDHYSRAFP